MRHLIIASTSTLHQQSYLEYLLPDLERLFKGSEDVLFIPFARPGGISHDVYTEIAASAFKKINLRIRGLHSYDDPIKAITNATAIFTGGGNTFVLVKRLHDLGLMNVLSEVINGGTPYLGTSAGSNICGINMKTTNDMPIVYPPSFDTMGLVPFNINPHYLDPQPNSTHMGETRAQRLKEFHAHNDLPVVGLREGSWLEVQGSKVLLFGSSTARIFEAQKEAYEVSVGTDLMTLF